MYDVYFYLLGKWGYVFGSVGLSVCLFVCLFVCRQHYSKSYERIGMKFYGGVLGSTKIKFWWWSGYSKMSKWAKNTIIVVAYEDLGAGNDNFSFFSFFRGRGGSLSPPRLNIFRVGNMGVMICLSQGGLRSLSASSYILLSSHWHQPWKLIEIFWKKNYFNNLFSNDRD